MRAVGLAVAVVCVLCGPGAWGEDTPAVTEPANQAGAQEAAPAASEPAKPIMPQKDLETPVPMPDVPKEVLATPAPMAEVTVPPDDVTPVPTAAPAANAPQPATAAPSPFERIFGDAVVLNSAMREQVLADEPGKRHYVDTNQDGKPEEVWYVDTAPRHPEEWRPLVVRAIDEDGDLQTDGQPDQDSDLYIADWHGDGTVDAVIDYTDTDGDNDVDEMGIYFLGTASFGGEGSVAVWWAGDVGDDNLLWYDVGYTYVQNQCQYHCHFGGNEMFCAFVLAPGADSWRPTWEDPFLFYDLDADGVTEEVIRYDVEDGNIQSYRQSFDADNDATLKHPRDFDMSVTAYPAKGGVAIDPAGMQQIQLRGIPTDPFIAFTPGQTAGASVAWDRMLFTWDEDDNNVDGDGYADAHERWEGVIAKGTDGFPQVGGPSCGAVNKRYELAVQTGQPIQVYFHPVDQRIHLRQIQRAWLDVDADQDHNADMKYTYMDSDGDGIIDTWNLDTNADGTVDDSWKAANVAVSGVAWNWAAVHAAYARMLASAPQALLALTQRLQQALTAAGADPNADPVARIVRNNFAAAGINPIMRWKFIHSDETTRFYLDLLKDRLIVQLKGAAPDAAYWPEFNAARGRGDFAAMQAQLEQAYNLTDPVPAYADWIAAKQAEVAQGPRVAYRRDWISDHIGWENREVAYRSYWGQIDVYGKSHDGFMLDQLNGDQQEGDWGVDALYVRDTAGCGGVTLYVNGKGYPVWSPQGKGFVTVENSLVEQTDDHVTIDIKAANVGPKDDPYTVRLRCTLQAGHRDTAIEALVEGGKPDDALELGINLTKLTQQPFFLVDQQAGVMAVRGYQTSNVGTIGLGVVFPSARFLRIGEAPSENQIVLSIKQGEPLPYHIQGDWVRGRRFPVAPSNEDWMNELRALAALLNLK